MMRTVSAAIEAAADVIEREGWTQGAYNRMYVDDEGATRHAHCIIGGVRAVVNYNGRAMQVRLYEQIIGALGDAITDIKAKDPADRIIQWNDRARRSRQQVLDFMREQAKVARIREEEAAIRGQ